MKRRCLVLVAVFLWSVPAWAQEEGPARPALTADRIPQNEELWYGLYLQGKKGGFAKIVTRREGNHYVQRLDLRLDTKSMGQAVKMNLQTEARFLVQAPFAYAGGSVRIDQAMGTQSKTATVKDGKLLVEIDAGNQKRTMELDAPDYTLADLLAPRLWVKEPRKVGDKLEVRAFDLQITKPFTSTLDVTAVEKSVVQGVPVTYYTANVVTDVMGPLGPTRMTDKGEMISMSMMGGLMEMRLEPEAVAKKVEEGGDLFFKNTVKLGNPIGGPRGVRKLVLRASGHADALERLEPGPRQSVQKNEDGSRTLTLGDPGAAVQATEEEIAENLKETPEFPVEHETVRELARLAAGDAKTDAEKVARLVAFVCGYVEDALRPEPVDVLEVCQSRKGDCQEHSILFTALARAAGIPARSVAGLAYMGDEIGAFGGHAWNEVVLDGRWVPVDATFNEVVIDATHIRIGTGLRGLLRFGWTMGKLELELVSVEPAPKK